MATYIQRHLAVDQTNQYHQINLNLKRFLYLHFEKRQSTENILFDFCLFYPT